MAVKKSELYSSIWASCHELRGGMDASQYKDYILTLLFIKYVSDKYHGRTGALIDIPEGASFQDMVGMKNQSDIGDRINKEVIVPLFKAMNLEGNIQLVDFNDDEKLGSGKEKVDRLTKLIAIFENPSLNFAGNRAEDDDILGDAYEYLMRHFATESGKSKGQFYTPAEVSRILASVIGIEHSTLNKISAYDPTCGSGSLLLKVAAKAPNPQNIALYGQEMDISTKTLAIMNMWLHGQPFGEIKGRNTLADPQFKDGPNALKRFDFVVANPPFSLKNWSSGLTPSSDYFHRFQEYGIPPEKNGDYAFLLHILASMKSTGKGAVILPHGVLFRGNAEAVIRKNLIQRKLIKGIIGLPANLFYGTGIPACIIVLDKEEAESREGIFMVDASKGFRKDGNKNRLREQDIHKIVDTFDEGDEVPKYAKLVPWAEIEQNEYNLNIPRYIDTQEEEDIQDLTAHLKGGIPIRDVEALKAYWEVYPGLQSDLFEPLREGYLKLRLQAGEIREAILQHPEFKAYEQSLYDIFEQFKAQNRERLRGIDGQTKPKDFIVDYAEDLLKTYTNRKLLDRYDIYQHLMDDWEERMKDDVYLLIEDGWVAQTQRILVKDKKGKEKDKGWTCELLPKSYIIQAYFQAEETALKAKEAQLDSLQAEIEALEEEHGGEEGLLVEALTDKGKLTKASISKRIKVAKKGEGPVIEEEALILMNQALKFFEQEGKLKKAIKEEEAALDLLAYNKYPQLSEEEVKHLVVEEKWLAGLAVDIQSEIDAISQRLSSRIKELAERYDQTLTEINTELKELEDRVEAHLKQMGLSW
ncbi:MAG: type I restriction-modification system subunit M [Bacteroidota bacterium]